MMGSSGKRTKTITEYVIDVGEYGREIDIKSFDYHYQQMLKQAKEDGVDFANDDALRVHLTDDEVVFRAQPTDD